MEKNKGLWILAVYFFLSVYLFPMFPGTDGAAGELAHWATAASLIEKSSFEIGWTRELTGENVRVVEIADKTYSAESPGLAVLSAPFYAVTRALTGPPDASKIRRTWFAMRFFLSTLPLVFLGFWLYRREADEISLAALLLATPLFVSSLLFTSSVLVAVLLYFAFRLLYDTERIFLRNCLLAGFLSGLAVICDFLALVPVLIFGAGLFFSYKRDRRSNLFVFALGAFPFLALLLFYNYAIFGSLAASFYGYESFSQSSPSAGHSPFGLPTPQKIYELLLSPARGLFFYAPILMLPVIAFFTARDRRSVRHRVKIAAVLISTVVLCGSAHANFAGGKLVLILPLLLDSFFDGEIFGFSNLWQGFLFTLSFFLCTIPIFTFPFAPPEFRFPHNDFWAEFLLAGNLFAPNLLNAFGFTSSIWTILPVPLLMFVTLFILRRYARRPDRFALGVLCGLILVALYLVLPGLDTGENEAHRTVLSEKLRESRFESRPD